MNSNESNLNAQDETLVGSVTKAPVELFDLEVTDEVKGALGSKGNDTVYGVTGRAIRTNDTVYGAR